MVNENLVWAIVWGVVFLLALVSVWWNPGHFVTLALSGIMCGLFIHDYVKTRGM